MKVSRWKTRFLNSAVFLLVACSGFARAQTNLEHRSRLLSSVAMSRFATNANAARYGFIPTNTPAFSGYVLDFLLANANRVNTQLNLGLPRPITSDHVTALRVTPKTNVWHGGITVLGHSGFGVYDGKFHGFTDLRYAWDALDRDGVRQAQLAQTNTTMTTNDALMIATNAFSRLGLSTKEVRLADSPECTSNVVSLRIYSRQPSPLPSNYFKLLGVSTNSAEWGRHFGYGVERK